MGWAAATAAIGCGSQGSVDPDALGSGDVPPHVDAGIDAGVDAPPQHVCADSYPRLDLKVDCGAVGDGVTNDSAAFRDAAARIEAAGGGELVIPPGVYIVGEQVAKTDPSAPGPYYAEREIFTIHAGSGVACLLIRGYGATIRIAPGLRYGGFDRATGEPTEVNGFIDADGAHVGRVFEISDSANVVIEGMEIDGNNGALILGGQWGNVDRQGQATGIWVNRCTNVTISDVHTHHHGLDGFAVLHLQTVPAVRKPHLVQRMVSEYNGRQALSWIGGWGLECVDSKFNHTGRALNNGEPLVSLPRAGLDIEPNAGTNNMTREGVFTRCEFVDNAGPGLVTAGGDGAYAKFVDCTFWGTTSYSIYAQHPGLEFVNSRFYGTATRASDGHAPGSPTPDPALATRFEGCTFEDKPWTDGRVFRQGGLYTIPSTGSYAGVTWKGCTFINHVSRSVMIASASSREIFDSCTFVFSATLAGNVQADFQNVRLVSCQFKEAATLDKAYAITVDNVEVGAPAAGGLPTHVDGPRVHWGTTSGLTGADIAPGTYTL